MKPNLYSLTATEIVKETQCGNITAEAVVRSCLERISEREPFVQAWQFIDPELAINQARAIDARTSRGALHGVPVGVKDIIDTADMPTEYGSPIHVGHRPHMDAICVALTRRAGGLILGKTVTTEFANRFPGKTMNPKDPKRTPGGSSSGSGAAVGDQMVPLALGTQTTGSTIRPAAYNGCFGYRPTWGDLRISGVMEAAGSLDTLGIIARSLDDVALYRDVLADTIPQPIATSLAAPMRVGVCRTQFWDQADLTTHGFIDATAQTMSKAGAKVFDLILPSDFDVVSDLHQKISSFEFARARAWELDNFPEKISKVLYNGRLKHGLKHTFDEYREARAAAEKLRIQLDDIFSSYDVILTPSAAGEAPVGLDATGTAAFSSIWTLCHTPSITLPLFTGQNGLPIGIQLVSRRDHDRHLFNAAHWTCKLFDR